MEEEELAKRWEGFQLTETEDAVFTLPEDVISESKVRGLHCLLGLIITEKRVNKEAFKSTMAQVWKLEGWVSFKEVGE